MQLMNRLRKLIISKANNVSPFSRYSLQDHPDVNKSKEAEEKFKIINDAYKRLTLNRKQEEKEASLREKFEEE